MKKIIFSIVILYLFFSCEDVVNIDLNEGNKELVINANVDWSSDLNSSIQKIIISETTGYFSDEIPMVSGAKVLVKDEHDNEFIFNEEDKGIYICRNFHSKYGELYRLEIELEDVLYVSEEKMLSPIEITDIIQTDDGGILNEDIELEIQFTTPNSDEINYFMIKANDGYNELPFFMVLDGDDFKNQSYFIKGSSDDWEKGDEVKFRIFHISENYFNYISKLLAVSDKYGGMPLTTPPARVQGNIINIKDTKSNPLGAFRVSTSIEAVIILE